MTQEKKIVFGIDLGTTYSCIAHVDEFGKPIIIKNSEGGYITPSVVLFEDENVIVGEEAKLQAVILPHNVVSAVKRHMGDPDYRFSYSDKEYRAEDISALILKKVANDASQSIGMPVEDVVITCPAYFGTEEKEATKVAGQIAGLNVLEIINEPTAAALAYGLQVSNEDQVVLVYDLGGGTFDVTIIAIINGHIQVIVTGGNDKLGGKDWDQALVNHFQKEYEQATGLDLEEDYEAAEDQRDAWLQAESAKKTLSARPKAIMVVNRIRQEVTLEEFEELTEPLLERTILYTRQVLDEARQKGEQYSHVDRILLVGGSTRMPQVKRRLQQEFNGLEPETFDPDEAVAKGAALYGQKLLIGEAIGKKISEGKTQSEAHREVAQEQNLRLPAVEKLDRTKVENVTSRGYGIVVINDAGKDCLSVLIPKNTPVPVEVSRQFGTVSPNQTTVALQIMETQFPDEIVSPENLNKCKDMGQAELLLPSPVPQGSPVQVTFNLNHEGILYMTGTDVFSGKQIEARFETKSSMSSEAISLAKQQIDKLQMV